MKMQTSTSRARARQVGRLRPARGHACSCTEARARNHRTGVTGAAGLALPAEFNIPEPLRVDQSELCQALERAVLSGGKTGAAARKLLAVLQPHLLKEEDDLLQTLGLLLPLCQGQITLAMESVPARTEQLKARRFEIVREHAAIIEAARTLLRVARAEHKLPVAAFTEHLLLRAWTDEVVFYPAAILIGEYLKLKLEKRTS